MRSYPLSSFSRSILPTSPGVYFFKDGEKHIIYVGKAKHLSHRVSSYFQKPLGEKTQKMLDKAKYLTFIEVGSELEALLLEAKLINQLKPFYNLISKDDKTPYYINITDKPIIDHNPSNIGPFLNRQVPLKILKLFRKIAPYCTAPKSQKNPCLYSHLGLCNPCPHSKDFNLQVYTQNLNRLKLLLSGKFSRVKKDLFNKMQNFSQNQRYEEAASIKKSLDYLDLLLSRPILPEDYLLDPNLETDRRLASLNALKDALPFASNYSRIETYDIAHLSGQNTTASMTVAINGFVDSKYFRHFKIKTVHGINDPASLAEVISRRLNHPDWRTPDLIVLDGGKSQLSAINIDIPVISLAKKQEIIYLKNSEIKLERNNPGLQLLQHLRDEAHRFSRRLHHKYRSAKMFI